jgi:hypothetical protein
MEDQVDALVVYQTGRDVELEAARQDAGRSDQVLNSLSLPR